MENEKGIYRLNFDCGRMGDLSGIFIANKEHVKVLIENKIQVYWGEVLGKHSEIYGPVDESEIVLVSDSPEAIKVIEDLGLENGYNPFDYTALNFQLEGSDEDFDDMSIDEIVEKIIELKNN
jgi:hypothetical protein